MTPTYIYGNGIYNGQKMFPLQHGLRSKKINDLTSPINLIILREVKISSSLLAIKGN